VRPDCDDACPYKRIQDDFRRLVGEFNGRLNRLLRGAQPSKKQNAPLDLVDALEKLGHRRPEAIKLLMGTSGTDPERLNQAIKKSKT